MVRACAYKGADTMYHIYGASTGSYAHGNLEIDLSHSRHFINLDIRYSISNGGTMNADMIHILGSPSNSFDVSTYIKRQPTCELWNKVLSDGKRLHYKVKIRRK